MRNIYYLVLSLVIFSCKNTTETLLDTTHLQLSEDILNYNKTPQHQFDRSGLMFSDQGAWFAYSLPDSAQVIGFTGPFLMTEQNGIWSSTSLVELSVKDVDWNSHKTKSYASHLEQVFRSKNLELTQQLVFASGHSAVMKATITNTSKSDLELSYQWKNSPLLAKSLSFKTNESEMIINSPKTDAIGHLLFEDTVTLTDSTSYTTNLKTITLKAGASKTLQMSTSFIFSEYAWEAEQKKLQGLDFEQLLHHRKQEKNQQLKALTDQQKTQFQDSIYAQVLAKAHLTLQNNWRIPAGEIKHEGLFPSYHYKWFNGFWSWDSWKHAVGLSYYDIALAKKQVKLMFEFQNEDGFVADCVYRDTSIEAHNYRDTKPPLSAWAVATIYKKDRDIEFVKYMYPKLKKYHEWWYLKRDHDKDGICEYGSTDGTAIAAKWESGMDNAIRFDDIKMLKNADDAYSMNQESVDLNAYLYAEKLFLAELADALALEDTKTYKKEAKALKVTIQKQFFDAKDGWFYDTDLAGTQFIKGEGSEGWTALWAKAAAQEQAAAVKERMMNPKKFYTKVPFQTMSADHPKFDPLRGYWRGPNWLDQSYFGVKALRNYGFDSEADQATKAILEGAEGLLGKGMSIRENYHPLTGKGGHAKNFSWSAAHTIMLLAN